MDSQSSEQDKPEERRNILLGQLIDKCSVSGLISSLYVSVSEVLEHILESPLSDTLIASYAAICRMGCHQYINGTHFCAITEEVMYKMVYVQEGCDLYAPIEEGGYEKLLTHLAEALALLRQEDEGANMVRNMCDPMPSTDKQSIKMVVRSGNSAGTSALLDNFDTSSRTIKEAIECDYTEVLSDLDPEKYWKVALARCKYLSHDMGQYWDKVASSKYSALVSSNRFQEKASISEKVEFAKVIPDAFEPSLRVLTDSSVRLLSLPPIARGYVFGYPIHIGLPVESKLIRDAIFIQENGIDAYVDKMYKYNKAHMNPVDACSAFGDVDMANTETLNASDVFSYNSFDILFYCEGGHIYSFSRESFQHLTKKRVNPYTKKKLPRFFLEMVSLRNRSSIVMRVPKCEPLKELLESHMTGKVGEGVHDNPMRSIENLCTSIGSDFLNGMMSQVSNALGMSDGDAAARRGVPISFSIVPDMSSILESS